VLDVSDLRFRRGRNLALLGHECLLYSYNNRRDTGPQRRQITPVLCYRSRSLTSSRRELQCDRFQSVRSNSDVSSTPMNSPSSPRCPGPNLSRRVLLQAGALSCFGLSLPDVLRLQSEAAPARPARRPVRGVILAYLTGGPSHLDTLDPKPNAPK